MAFKSWNDRRFAAVQETPDKISLQNHLFSFPCISAIIIRRIIRMEEYIMTVYKTRGVCSRSIEIELDGDTIASVKFNGGCNGNTKGIASLVKGMKVDEVIERLKGTDCGGRGTSCPDQLALALESIKAQNA